uniref:Helicase-associated domain-containing protein n=1 Tax=Ditylum brightwellii TaxID=49249 RepID=A0A7S4SC08_9STRA
MHGMNISISSQLCAFKAKNGHCDVSQNDEQNKCLGQWIKKQRTSYKKKTLRSCAFKAKNGHCIVSQNDAQNISLVEWVRQQRLLYKKNTLNSNYIQQLNSIGFIWVLHERSYERSYTTTEFHRLGLGSL